MSTLSDEKYPIVSDGMVSVLNIKDAIVEQWPIKKVLNEINRDHSDGWIDYTIEDWVEGWNEWVEGSFYSIYLK